MNENKVKKGLLTFEFFEEFDDETLDMLWEQNVVLDDWDFALLTFDVDQFESETVLDFNDAGEKIVPVTIYSPTSYYAQGLLNRNHYGHSKWYKIKWKSGFTDDVFVDAFLGLAYH